MTVGRRVNDELDRYMTDPEETEKFLRQFRPRTRIERVLEPAAGTGQMIAPLQRRFPNAEVMARDIRSRSSARIGRENFFDTAQGGWDLIFTNPPFNQAIEFAEHGLSLLRRGGILVLLLRLAILESKKRKPWWREHMPELVTILSERPSFTGGGTDSAAYAWIQWRNRPELLRADHFEGRIL